ncbi:hypothetical protein HY570_02485, partial [Candidatus Micrarchaeota archaeon]|nr:hypothetical protein [Candidatus Micrarchaeota archaeon]
AKTIPTFKILSTKIVFFALLFVVFFSLVILLMVLFVGPSTTVGTTTPSLTLNPGLTAFANEVGHASFSQDESLTNTKEIAYATIKANATNLDYINSTIVFYNDYIPKDVYLVIANSEQTESYDEFRHELQNELESQGIILNEIHISQLEQLPPRTNAIFIVPTGFVPALLLGLEGNFTYLNLVNSNSTIIYIGHAFNFGALTKDGRKIQVDQRTLDKFGLDFRQESPTSSRGYSFSNAQYSVSASASGTSIRPEIKNLHGSMFSARYPKGYLFFVPNSLDGGWSKNGTKAASDVAKLIRETGWQQETAKGNFIIPVNSTVNETKKEITTIIYTDSFETTNGTLKILLTGVYKNKTLDVTLQYPLPTRVKGRLNHNAVQMPTSLTDKTMTINGLLNEDEIKTARIHILSINSTGDVVSDKLVSQRLLPTKSPFSYQYTVDLSSDDYVLKAVDDSGYLYAQSFLHIPNLNINLTSANWERGIFFFEVTIKNLQTKRNEKIAIKNVKISLDDKQSKTLATNETTLALVYRYNEQFDQSIPAGQHKFTFDLGVQKININAVYTPSVEWYQNPLYQVGILIVVVLFIGGALIKRPEAVIYKLDVPDFPPFAITRVPVTQESVISIFDQVNKNFKWSYMPLNIQELKAGFSKLHHQGRPLLIGDFNLERILDSLASKNKVQKVLSLYGLNEWEKATRHSLEYLAIFRKMRDIFVRNAIPFTDLGISEDASTIISGNVYVHIYENDGVIPNVLSTIGKGETILVFDSKNSIEEFTDKMYSSSSAMQVLKIQYTRGNLVLAAVEDLEKILIV